MAGQLKFSTSRGAANNIATVRPILTISHKKNPATAAPGFIEDTLLVIPRAITAPGTTTASAPYKADQPTLNFPVKPQAAPATRTPTNNCHANIRQGETEGLAARSF